MVRFDTTALWALLIACSLLGALTATALERRRTRHQPPRRLVALGRYVDAGMTGIGVGMTVVVAILMLAAVFARIS